MIKMKRLYIITTLALLAVSCAKEPGIIPVQDGEKYKFSFKASFGQDEDLPESKSVLGESVNGKPQPFWTDGDRITVYTSADGMGDESAGVSMVGYVFSTSLGANSPEATFGYTGDDFNQGAEYIAIYPDKGDAARSVNFTTHKMANVVVPAKQTLSAGTYDRNAMVAIGYSTGGSSLVFRNATALVKFQVSESGIINGALESESPLAGTFRGEIRDTNPAYLDTYSNGATYNKIDFTIDGSTPLTPGTDYYIAVRPGSISGGLKFYLNGQLVKTFTNVTSIARNKVYDMGVLSLPVYSAEKHLTFDVTDAAAMAGFPTTSTPAGKVVNDQIVCPYTLYGDTYNFISTTPVDASTVYFPYYDATNKRLAIKAYWYLGLPAIEGYKLVGVDINVIYSNKTSVVIGISSNIGTGSAVPTYVSGGEQKTQAYKTNGLFSFDLSDTAENTVYWINARTAIGISEITLTYVPVRNDDIVRIGTYNIKTIIAEDDENNNWEYRKTRLVQSIRENDFDVWGINECSTEALSYLAGEFASTYNFQMFSPYSQDGNGDKMQGIVYKKTFSLSNWHYFWLSNTPDIMVTNDGTSNRGGCCATLTRDGTPIFVMVTHGAQDTEVKETYAPLFAQMEAAYNTSGAPSFFVGDMNARPDQPTSLEYKKTWNDTYESVSRCDRTGPLATYNAFNLSRNMYTHPSRIDYVYYKGATPLNYVCNDTRYDGYYASDHLPVYSDMRVR